MIRLVLAAVVASLFAFPAVAQGAAPQAETPAPAAQPADAPLPPPSAPPPARQYELVGVQLVTTEGPILLALEKERAPVTTANFLRYVDQKRLDGTSFYRALSMADGTMGLIQGGVGQDGKRLLPPISHEPTTQTGLGHGDGSISMARLEPGSARGDFFITIGPLTSLDANPQASGDNLGFAVFGHVVEGMDVVRRILSSPISQTLGEGVMRGQMITKPVKIVSAKRAALPPREAP